MLTEVLGAPAAEFIWAEPAGVGFLEVDNEGVYDDDYFRRYRAMSATPMAKALNGFRCDLVAKHSCELSQPTLLDVGIGDGAFLRSLSTYAWVRCYGADVNPAGVAYLIEHGQLASIEDPEGFDVVTFWDSLEHIRDPRPALKVARSIALVSIPIFRDAAEARASKHYRPDEHYWYFSRRGFIAFAEAEGFEVLDVLATETALGREGIETFVLKRRAA